MNDNNMKTNSLKSTLKADIFDFTIPFITFFTVYFLTKEIINEENYIKTALIYLLFFIGATAYIVIKRKAFHPEALLTGACCIALDTSLAFHGNFITVPLLMAYSAIYCLTLTRTNIHTSGSYLYAFDLLQKAFTTPVANLFLPLTSMLRSLKSLKKSKRNFGVLAGLLLAVPLLAVLLILLMNSDAAFESFADGIISKLSDSLPRFDFDLFAFASLIFTPYIVSMLFAFKYGIDSEKGITLRANIKKLRFANTAFLGGFLGSVCLLYVVYLLSQTAYFFSAFGGKLPDGTEITLAEYARRGFFEMSAVAAINLCLIGAGAIFSKRQGEKFTKIFKALALFLCVFTMVLITTAMSKMILYINELGLTHKRLAVSVFNVLMFLAFIFIIIRLFKKHFPYFRYISVISLVVVTVFMLVGSDSIIGYYNTACYLSGKHDTLDLDLLYYDLNNYDSVKNLDRLVDDTKYGTRAKTLLAYEYENHQYWSDTYTVDRERAKRYIDADKERFEEYHDHYYHNAFDSEITVSEEDVYFYLSTDISIDRISIYTDSVVSPKKGDVFSFTLYTDHSEVSDFHLTISYLGGNIYETVLTLEDSNFFEITEAIDGSITVISLPYVNSFEDAVNYMATIIS